jgi:hypothetical protein
MASPRTIKGNLRTWTPEMDDIIRKCVAAGERYALAVDRIKKDLGVSVTKNAIIGRANRMGLSNPAPKSTANRPLIPKPSKASRRVERTPRMRGHEGMRPLRPTVVNRFVEQMTKAQLRAELAQAVRNTAAMPVE